MTKKNAAHDAAFFFASQSIPKISDSWILTP